MKSQPHMSFAAHTHTPSVSPHLPLRPPVIDVPYKNVLFVVILLLWYGPISMLFLTVLTTVLYGPVVTLPFWRRLLRETYQECCQLYVMATHEQIASPENNDSVGLFTLRSVAKKLKNRFYDTL